jgi:hypothetical protein
MHDGEGVDGAPTAGPHPLELGGPALITARAGREAGRAAGEAAHEHQLMPAHPFEVGLGSLVGLWQRLGVGCGQGGLLAWMGTQYEAGVVTEDAAIARDEDDVVLGHLALATLTPRLDDGL